MKVVWTDEATLQLDGIYAFVARNSEYYARKLIDKLVARADTLGDFHFLGEW
jgi:plasmid stabilization system protein ParE